MVEALLQNSLQNRHSRAAVFLSHAAGFLFVIAAAYWLRRISIEPDALLQGYLQVVSGLLAFVFAVLTLVRFQGTQDRIS
jgi:apolipoprotein N-acyltransferase